MQDIITAPLPKRPWYKRTWGVITIFVLSVMALFIIWLTWTVYVDVQLIKSGKMKPLSAYQGDFSTSTSGGTGIGAGANIELAPKTSPSRGGGDKPAFTVVEFGDFQCPYTGKEFPIIRPLMETLLNVKFVYRDFPLTDIHPDAMRAAEASHCAQEQDKFWAFHDQVFLNQSDLSENALIGYATAVGVDTDKFKSCLTTEKYKMQVMRDHQDGVVLGVRGTPTFFIEGVKFEGALPADAWQTIIDRLHAL
ncbi:MAG: DsbA family protein [Candidatus Magasanikbacteria bacterium]|nr:DsbA family protein [Candidatus Magasanikbacteria bacterium]